MTEPAHDTSLLPREPGTFRVGDTVIVYRPGRKFHGKRGEIVYIDPDHATGGNGDLLRVRVGRVTLPLFADEIQEVVQ